MTGSRKPEYGICGACGRSRHLRADGTVGAHQYMTPYGHRTSTACAGVGTLPRERSKPVMPQRNRYARLSELVEILAAKTHEGYMAGKRATGTVSRLSESGEEVMVPFERLSESSKDINRAAAAAVLDGLSALGVQVTALVKIVVDADTDKPLYQELEQGKPHMIPAPKPVNTCESAEDAARRFAGQVGYAEQLLNTGRAIVQAMDQGTADPARLHEQAREWLKAASEFPHGAEDNDR